MYLMQLVWHLGAQLFALGGGRDYPVPDAFSLFEEGVRPDDKRSLEDIRLGLLRRLGFRKEVNHG